MILSELEESRK